MVTNHSNHDDDPRSMDARNLTLPIITMISIIGFVIWVTYIGTTMMSENRAKLVTVENTLMELKEEIRNMKTLSKGPDRALTVTDMAIFCLRAQILNKDWRCPSVNHTYDSMNHLNDNELLMEIDRLNKRQGNLSPLDKSQSSPSQN